MHIITPNFLLLFVLMFFGLFSCEAPEPSPDEVLARVVEKINENRSVQYGYHSYWDNRFNESVFRDSVQIIYSKVDSSAQGFGFYAGDYEDMHLFDGIHYQKIQHEEKRIVNYPTEEIQSDPSYFSSMMFFFATPFELKAVKSFANVIDTVLDKRKILIYRQIEKNPSVIDSSKTITQQRLYYVDRAGEYVTRVQNITLEEKDTTQIIDYYFSEVRFDSLPYDFGSIERSAFAGYREISEADLDREVEMEQIAPGDRLIAPSYVDVNDEKIALYGTPGKETLIMFSFIGCGGCEYAMREMSKKDYQIREGLDFYYSSHLDKKTTLRSYLEKKDFPFGAFAKESEMNQDFSIFAFPTFVLIDSDGVVQKVLAGYDEQVEEVLFGGI